ncbi:hypothetical protein ACRAVF_01455 [Bradyrhizobium oligotrophicum S58]
MSAPDQNDPAKPAPPWANEELRRYAPRRRQAEAGPTTFDPPADGMPLPHHLVSRPSSLPARPAALDLDDEEVHRAWSAKLDPVVMPLPPEDPDKSLRLSSIIKIGAAVGIAASIAMMVVNMVSFENGGPTPGSKSPIMPTAVLESLAQIDPAEAKVAQEDPRRRSPRSRLPAVQNWRCGHGPRRQRRQRRPPHRRSRRPPLRSQWPRLVRPFRCRETRSTR